MVFDFLNLAVDSFCSGIGLLMAQRITDAFSVSFKHLGDLDDLTHGLLLHTLKPEFEVLFASAKVRHQKMALNSSLSLQAMLTCKFNFWMAWKISS